MNPAPDPGFLVGSGGALPCSPALMGGGFYNQCSSPSLLTGLSNQSLVGEDVRGQRALAGDCVHAVLPTSVHQPHHLQVYLAARACMHQGWQGEGAMASLWAAQPHFHPAPHREKRLQPVGCLTRLRAFFTAPVVIFHMNILSYFTFLLLFAYVLMVDFQPLPSWREYLIYFWLFSLVCEETRQVRGRQSRGWEEARGGRDTPLGAPGRSCIVHVPMLLLMSPSIWRGPSTRDCQIPPSLRPENPWPHLIWPPVLAKRHAVLS